MQRYRISVSWLFVILILATITVPAGQAQPLFVRHIQGEDKSDLRYLYPVALLDLALSKTEGAYQLVESTLEMYQGRAMIRLQKGQDLDVVFTMTTVEREQMPGLRPIRIPLQKGLIGMRLFLINAADTARFCTIVDEDHLKSLVAGQGHDWPDTSILKTNGYPVNEVASYGALFRMLRYARFDYFPRSILEIWAEATQYAEEGLVIEKCLMLHYPAAVYFFVNADNTVLGDRLEEGLRRAVADGSFERLFTSFYGPLLEQARLSDRRRFSLTNPLLPPETPLEETPYWYKQ